MAKLAEYRGRCGACGEDIEEGDPIVPDEDYGWVHEDCAEDDPTDFEGTVWYRGRD